MVRIFGESVFVGDYGLTINVETDLGLITILTAFPRLNKWIGVKLVDTFSIMPDEKIYGTGDTELHVRDLQTFLHQVIIKVQTDSIKTQEIVKRYKEVYAED
jgi:hypothetical protein